MTTPTVPEHTSETRVQITFVFDLSENDEGGVIIKPRQRGTGFLVTSVHVTASYGSDYEGNEPMVSVREYGYNLTAKGTVDKRRTRADWLAAYGIVATGEWAGFDWHDVERAFEANAVKHFGDLTNIIEEPEAHACPACGSTDTYDTSTTYQWRCNACGEYFTVGQDPTFRPAVETFLDDVMPHIEG